MYLRLELGKVFTFEKPKKSLNSLLSLIFQVGHYNCRPLSWYGSTVNTNMENRRKFWTRKTEPMSKPKEIGLVTNKNTKRRENNGKENCRVYILTVMSRENELKFMFFYFIFKGRKVGSEHFLFLFLVFSAIESFCRKIR